MKRNSIVSQMCMNALFASLYITLVIILGDYSFGFNGIISLRIAEVLIPICCFDKRFIVGAILGCLISNIIGGNVVDMIVGTLQTTISVMILHFLKNKQLAIILASLTCGIMIGLEIYILGFSLIGFWVLLTTSISELIILEFGYLLIKGIYPKIMNRNI